MDSNATVADLMQTTVYSITPEISLADALDAMLEHEIRHLPVVDDEGLVLGVVSHRDVLAQGVREDRLDAEGDVVARLTTLRDIRVEEVMSAPDTVTPETELGEAATQLLDGGYGCLPVVDNQRLVGMLTESDFVRLALG